MLNFRLKGLPRFLLAVAILFPFCHLQAQDKQASPRTFKIGFLMDSLKVERWQTDLDKFQKRAVTKVNIKQTVIKDGFQNLETIEKSLPKEKWPQ